MKISIRNICKSYKENGVLGGISFDASSGEIIGITGSNGCGKTTLLSILVGLTHADSGEIWIDDNRVESLNEGLKNHIGYVPQINPLPDELTVKECLKLWCSDREIFDMIVEKYNLKEFANRRISKLSGGMKRRCAIACAMATMPGVLIMDEPTAALDITYKDIIHRDMIEFARAGGILIMVTHEAEEIAMCNTCLRIEAGQC